MPGRIAAMAGVWAVLAVCSALGGCTSSGERLPQCRGQAVPINAASTAAAPESTTVTDIANVEAGGLRGGVSHVE